MTDVFTPPSTFQPPTFLEIERTLPDYIRWQSIAFDAALRTPPELLARMHRLANSQLLELLRDTRFREMVVDTRKALAKGGMKAGFRMRAGMMAEELLPELRTVAKSEFTDAKTKLAIFEALTRFADFDPGQNKNRNEGVQVTFAFGAGLPGLSRLSGQSETIDQ